jgi:hypothetical protein
MVKFLFVFIILISCTTKGARSDGLFYPEKEGVEPVFLPYLESYQQLIGTRKYENKIKSTPILFGDTDGALGVCTTYLLGRHSITINRAFWLTTDETGKMFVIYHELEHCIRKRPHTNIEKKEWFLKEVWKKVMKKLGFYKPFYLKDGCPISIMNSHLVSYYCRIKHYDYYLKELADY